MSTPFMKPKNRVFRNLLKSIGYFLLTLLGVELVLYFLVPVYDFPEPHPFSGDKLYNPYQGIDSTHWRKANFHFHTRAWAGLTNGRRNTHEAFYKTYKSLGYDAPQISNYMSIDRTFEDSTFYIPGYEHGIGVRKKHQILIGSHHVLWLDYSFIQNLNHKQHMLNLLRQDNDVVGIAHPDWEGGYSTDEMRYLSNYDMVEALNHNWRSVPQWDAALSAGRAVYILADDDAHDIDNPNDIQRCCTFVNSQTRKGADIVSALKAGRAFGADIYLSMNEGFAEKAADAKLVPWVSSVNVSGDTLQVTVSERPLKITFIGQEGETKKIVRLSKTGWYKFQPGDTYIRTEITFIKNYKYPTVGTGSTFYLNPVFRYDGTPPSNPLLAEINWPRTWILRLLGLGSVAGLFAAGWFVKRGKTT